MTRHGSHVSYYIGIGLTVGAAAWGSIRYGAGIPWEMWNEILVFLALIVYFHSRSVNISKRMNFSIGASIIFPVIYLYGTGTAMLLGAMAGIVDGVAGRKSWDRLIFNTAQLSLVALVGGVVYENLGGTFGTPVFPRDIWAMAVSGMAFILFNIGMVALVSALWYKSSWLSRLRAVGLGGLGSSMASGYIGVIFTMFAASYGLWGILLFGILLLELTELLQAGLTIKVERALRKELEEELVVDFKTQVYNFRYLNEWLADPKKEKVSALFLDIDDFKVFNDMYGHAEGDRVLTALAQTITKCVRSDDKVIRYGGEEFVVLLPCMGRLEAEKVAARIQQNLTKLPYAQWNQPITVSIGIAAYPEDAKDKHQLLLMADRAMYMAKSSGKNCYHLWTSEVSS